MSKRILLVLGLFSAAVLIVLGSGQITSADDGPFGPINMAANRAQYTGKCPVEIIYTATINFKKPHPKGFVFNYHWERSDGGKTAVQTVKPNDNQGSMVIREPWKFGAAGQQIDASMKLFINSGNTHIVKDSPVVKVICK